MISRLYGLREAVELQLEAGGLEPAAQLVESQD